MAEHFNADDSDHSSSAIACACGQTARYAGRRPKTFTTLLGPLTLERAYYHCAACRRGSCPRDRALVYNLHGLMFDNRSTTPRLDRPPGRAAEVGVLVVDPHRPVTTNDVVPPVWSGTFHSSVELRLEPIDARIAPVLGEMLPSLSARTRTS